HCLPFTPLSARGGDSLLKRRVGNALFFPAFHTWVSISQKLFFFKCFVAFFASFLIKFQKSYSQMGKSML
ncbi:MAG: hypothetical protein IJZ37_06080, partial [Clostridia bacterium]|nr:hypothetical protein [Clostridia bacterium]